MYWMQIYLKSYTTLRALICGLIDADNSHSEIGALTFMVRSPEAETMYLSSKSTTLTAALCPTRTRRRLMSVGEAMSHTAMERSFEQVTINPLQNRRWSTASLWWIRVFRTSPEFTSQTLGKKRRQEVSADFISPLLIPAEQTCGVIWGGWRNEQRTYRKQENDRNLTWQWNQRSR